MNISVESFKRVDLLTLSGKIDSTTATKLDQTISDLHTKGRKNLVMDLSNVDFLSSAGLRSIITAHKDGQLVLVSPSDKVLEVFNLTGLQDRFEIANDTTSAVGSF
ncbi:MAG TPA: STAS domain-containing protein [Anaerolineae bacterium]|nr:STAS domain-containing protein [Anaerolineae bacterium]